MHIHTPATPDHHKTKARLEGYQVYQVMVSTKSLPHRHYKQSEMQHVLTVVYPWPHSEYNADLDKAVASSSRTCTCRDKTCIQQVIPWAYQRSFYHSNWPIVRVIWTNHPTISW